MKINDSILQTFVQRIRAAIDPEKIILFGSAASGIMTADSDIDLLIRHSGYNDQMAENERVRFAISDLGIPMDIFPMNLEWSEKPEIAVNPVTVPNDLIACVLAHVEAIDHIVKNGGLVPDADDEIFDEYRHNLSMKGQPGIQGADTTE